MAKQIKNSFNAGETSEDMSAREDLVKYHSGCSQVVNATLLPQGGAVKRSGTEYIATAKRFPHWVTGSIYAVGQVTYNVATSVGTLYVCDTAHTAGATFAGDSANWTALSSDDTLTGTTFTCPKIKLFPFEFSVADTLVLEFGMRYIRFYKDGDRVLCTAIDVTSSTKGASGAEVRVVATDHGLSSGDTVRFYDVSTMTELNYNGNHATEWPVEVIDSSTFDLIGTDSDDFAATGASGTLKRIYEINSPYTADEVFEIHATESADVYYVAHEDVFPQKLSRDGDTDWTIENMEFGCGPFLIANIDDDLTLTFTETSYEGSHCPVDNGSSATIMEDVAATFVVDGLIGDVIYNTIDGSYGVITDNSATTVTVADLLGGEDGEWQDGDTYIILSASADGYYHGVGEVGTLKATGHTPFVSTHVGSIWLMELERIGDNFATISGLSVVSGTVSTEVPVLGDFAVNAAGFNTTAYINTITLQRRESEGTWQSYRQFTQATNYSSTETENGVSYRLKYTGAATLAGFNAVLTAQNQTQKGKCGITSVTDSNTASVTIYKKIFRDVEELDVTGLDRTVNEMVKVTCAAHGLSDGDRVVFTDITSGNYTFLNYNEDDNNTYIVCNGAAGEFYLSGTAGANIAAATTLLGDCYHLKRTSTTSDWAEGAFSSYRGYPRTVSFYEDRLWWASTTNNPQTIWGSKSQDYEDHLAGTMDNDAVIHEIRDNDVSQIQWMSPRQVLVCGTSNKEYTISASNPDNPITPSDVKIRPISSHGSGTLQPALLNESIFFAQRQGRKIRAMRAVQSGGGYGDYNSSDSTLIASHMFESSPVHFAVARIPDSLLYVVREDGQIAILSYEPVEEVGDTGAWSRFVTGSSLLTPIGFYESMAIVSGSTEDDVYTSIKRIVSDGSTGTYTYRYVEKAGVRLIDEIDESLNLDCAVREVSDYTAQNIILASETAWCGSGECGISLCGGTV